MTNAVFALILTVFSPAYNVDGGPARSDVWVLDHNLTAEDCTERLALYQVDGEVTYGPNQVLSCSVDQDF